PNIHDVLLHLMARLGWTRTRSPRLGWRGRLWWSRRLSAHGSDRFIAFPHGLCPSDGPHRPAFCGPGGTVCVYRVERFASIWPAAKGCLVLLLSGLSGSGTMNDSPCVSTLTTTRRLPSPPRSARRCCA